MNVIRNCHRLLNKLCWAVEQRDIFASGITQQRPHTSICAKLGFVIVFQSKHFFCYCPAQSTSITQSNFNQNTILTNTRWKDNLICYLFIFCKGLLQETLFFQGNHSLCAHQSLYFIKCTWDCSVAQRLNVMTQLASILLTSLRPWRWFSTCRLHTGNGSWPVLACIPQSEIAWASVSWRELYVCQGPARKWPAWMKELLHLQTLHVIKYTRISSGCALCTNLHWVSYTLLMHSPFLDIINDSILNSSRWCLFWVLFLSLMC